MSIDVELENRLDNWAYWIVAFKRGEIGYPSKSTIADFGLPDSHVRQSKPPFPLNNLQADEINGWINRMGECVPEYKTAICDFYLRKDGLRIWELAEMRGISTRTFNEWLRLARAWLGGMLSRELNGKP